MRERDHYAEVGVATRAAIEQALATAEGNEISRYGRVFLAVLHQTASWSRLADSTYRDYLAELAGVEGKVAGKLLGELAERGVIVWVPARGRGRRSVVGLPGSMPVQPPLLGSVKGGQLGLEKGVTYEPKRGRAATPYREGPRRPSVAIANVDCLPCNVCGRVELFGFVYATLWYCERHRQDVSNEEVA